MPKRAPSVRSEAFLFVSIVKQPGAGQPPRLVGADILSDGNPTQVQLPCPGHDNSALPQFILVTSTTGRDFGAARARLIRKIQATPLLTWLRPWTKYWAEGGQPQPAQQDRLATSDAPPFASLTSDAQIQEIKSRIAELERSTARRRR